MATSISTRTIAALAPPADLLRLGQSVAMLDAILFPDDFDMRYHSHDAAWGPGAQVFSMRNGEGDFYFLWCVEAGAVLQGFGHESPMSPWSRERSKESGGPKPVAGLFDGLPKALASHSETAASFCADEGEVTFCAWWTKPGPWRIGEVTFPASDDPDGSEALLFILDGKPETYATWAEDYDQEVPLAEVKKVYARAPLTEELVAAINPEADFAVVAEEAKGIGYPVAG